MNLIRSSLCQVTAFYTAQLTAVLTTQERRLPVSTLHELQVSHCFRLLTNIPEKNNWPDRNNWSLLIILRLQADSSASWLAVGGNALETIINTWPEFSGLRADIASGKGTLVASQAQALESIQANEGVYFLADSESVRDIVFADYMRKKGTSEPLCSLTYTESFK